MIFFYIFISLVLSLVLFFILRIFYFNRKFKRDSKYPCFVVVSQDGFITKPMYYDEAKKYSDAIYGYIYVDREEYNKLVKNG